MGVTLAVNVSAPAAQVAGVDWAAVGAIGTCLAAVAALLIWGCDQFFAAARRRNEARLIAIKIAPELMYAQVQLGTLRSWINSPSPEDNHLGDAELFKDPKQRKELAEHFDNEITASKAMLDPKSYCQLPVRLGIKTLFAVRELHDLNEGLKLALGGEGDTVEAFTEYMDTMRSHADSTLKAVEDATKALTKFGRLPDLYKHYRTR